MGSIDLDGVLCTFLPAFLEEVNSLYNLFLMEEDVVEYDFVKLGLRRDQIYTAFDSMLEKKAYESLPIVDDALSAVYSLSEAYNLMISTSRDESTKAQTDAWLQKQFPKVFTPVVFNGNNKRHIMQAHSCLFHVDDYAEHISSIEGTDTLPVLYTRRYNKKYITHLTYGQSDIHIHLLDYYCKHKGWPSVRVQSWKECVTLLLEFAAVHPK